MGLWEEAVYETRLVHEADVLPNDGYDVHGRFMLI